MRIFFFLGGLALLGLALGCAHIAAPREQAAVPPAPLYPPTALPQPTSSPAPQINYPDANAPSAPTRAPIRPQPPTRNADALNAYRRGIAYVATRRGEYASDASRRALDQLFATGANYISVLVTWYQDDIHSTVIAPTYDTPTDADLEFVIAYAHAHGVKVLLKPQLDLSADDQHWRGQIQFEREADWEKWFASYRRFILYYARLAQANGAQEFAVGTELYATTTRAQDWRALIRAVRQEYTGILTYAANHSGEELQVEFWDDLDYIGVNVFYHLTNYRAPTRQQILDGWQAPLKQLTRLHEKFPRQPIVFTEVGYPSMDMASAWPWNWERQGAVDLPEQALLYEVLFQLWWNARERPWFRGMFIWNWLPDPQQGGPDDADYTPRGKPAEKILKYYYQRAAQE
ncbi:MAG: hypothetical protein BroJett039_05740 [Chloroflexota bacterium]|nr:MAG: hypothetical protein BroJett039_05740 [Chloroflexota bacterium]